MKKNLIGLILLFISSVSFAQVFRYSNEEVIAGIKKGEKQERNVNIKNIDTKSIKTCKEIRKELKARRDSTIDSLQKLRLYILQQNAEGKEEETEDINELIDSVEKTVQKQIHNIRYWCKIDSYRDRYFFPAHYSSQAIRFFEGDTVHNRLFQNNLVNYNPLSKKMTLYTEAVNDYVGPVRIGIGFQVKSEGETDSLSTPDSTQKLVKKEDLVSSLQNGGGDISLSFQLPVIKTKNSYAVIQSRFYLYANTGFSLPVLNKANEDFLFNYSGGFEGAFYASGFNKKLTFFTQLKGGYYNGNKNYRKVIKDADENDDASFTMLQSSFGLDFMGGYRVKVDIYSGNSFVRKSFPATITFIVKP